VSEVEILSDDECWALLTGAVIGRLAYAEGDDVEIYPVNFMVHDRTVFFRTAPGSKLEAIGSRPNVAFEVDEHGPIWVWSVIVRGRAERMAWDDEIETSGVLDLASWSPEEKNNFVRIVPSGISGRRFRLPTPNP